MTLIGPAYLALTASEGSPVEFSDELTDLNYASPDLVSLPGLNKTFHGEPRNGHVLNILGVQADMTDGTLWRFLWDNAGLPVTALWSSKSDGDVYFTQTIYFKRPNQGGQPDTHGTFTIPAKLDAKPTITTAPSEE